MPYHAWKGVLDAFPKAVTVQVGERFFELAAARSAAEIEVPKWSTRVGEQMCEAMLAANPAWHHRTGDRSSGGRSMPRHIGFTYRYPPQREPFQPIMLHLGFGGGCPEIAVP